MAPLELLRRLGGVGVIPRAIDWGRRGIGQGVELGGLNKGEARNALARAIFFCQLGELRDQTFENQSYRASGLNLATDDLGIEPDTMRHVAPLGWEHLSLTGDYAWTADDQPASGELWPLRTTLSLLAA